jgi:uncharacterized coiled-coil protein SlyX
MSPRERAPVEIAQGGEARLARVEAEIAKLNEALAQLEEQVERLEDQRLMLAEELRAERMGLALHHAPGDDDA